jgi:DNA-binding Lrp family transcriptional regulator
MDDTDRKLLALLSSNPRASLQELAQRLRISKQAVHHRIHDLTDEGVLIGTTAAISFEYLRAIPVAIFGASNAPFIEETMNRLGESDFARRVVIAGGNYIYVVGVLRNLSELDEYVEFVRHAAEIPDPTVGIYSLDEVPIPNYHVDGIQPRKSNYRKLTPVDLRIIASLKDDARRPVSEIAEIAGITSRTARRSLDSMIADGSIEFHARIDDLVGGETLSLIHIKLNNGSNTGEVAKKLLSKFRSLETYIRAFSNIPDFLMMAVWSDDLREIRTVFREICEERDSASVTLNIAYLERIYHTAWRDNLLDALVAGYGKMADAQVP